MEYVLIIKKTFKTHIKIYMYRWCEATGRTFLHAQSVARIFIFRTCTCM